MASMEFKSSTLTVKGCCGVLRQAVAYWRWLDVAPTTRKEASEVVIMSSPVGWRSRVVSFPTLVETVARRSGSARMVMER